MMDIPQVLHVQRVAGYGLLAGQGNSFGMLILKLKPWDESQIKQCSRECPFIIQTISRTEIKRHTKSCRTDIVIIKIHIIIRN